MSEQWWPIYRIKFTAAQMWFLINNLKDLHDGNYPPNPYSSSYDIELPLSRKERRYREPTRNKVLELAAEVEIRIGLVMNLMKGWDRLDRKFYKKDGKIWWRDIRG